jgi:hypothetical protein
MYLPYSVTLNVDEISFELSPIATRRDLNGELEVLDDDISKLELVPKFSV